MAVIKTIKPDGTGDFITLQSWWDSVKESTNPAQWAEVYGGGDVGGFNQTAMPNATPDENNYPKIYVANGFNHNGKIPENYNTIGYSTGPFILRVRYTRIIGMFISYSGRIIEDGTHSIPYWIEGNILHNPSTGKVANIFRWRNFTNNASITFFNNIVISKAETGDSTIALIELGTNNRFYANVYNNTILSTVDCIGLKINVSLSGGSTQEGSIIVNNLSIVGSGGKSYIDNTVGIMKGTQNNASSDDTSYSQFGGDDNLINISLEDNIQNFINNWHLKDNSILIGKGKSTESIYDSIKQLWNNPPSIGAIEYIEMTPTGQGKLLFSFIEGKRVMFNSQEYKKIIYNNEIIWSKDSNTGLRNILVGDNLSGKTLYLDFPDNIHNLFPADADYISEVLEFGPYGYIAAYRSTPSDLIIQWQDADLGDYIYHYNGTEVTDNKNTILIEQSTYSDNSIVNRVDKTNPAYQYIKIEG